MIIKNVEDLAKIIKKTRKEQGITQADLAFSAQVGVRFIVDIEKGKKTAQIEKVLKVCAMLGLKIEVL